MIVPTMARGDIVKTMFDTGAFGYTTLYGRVTKAGPSTYTVEWESGLTNRVSQGYAGVAKVGAGEWRPKSVGGTDGA